MKESREKLQTIKGKEDFTAFEQRMARDEDEMAKLALIVIVFSTIAIETYIYDYAARRLGDAYVKEHLDKLDTVSKWVVIPELVTGRELPQSQNWYALLKNLVKTRNALIHYKSSNPPSSPSPEFMKKMKDRTAETFDAAHQSTTLLNLLADKISAIDPEETPWVQSYLK